MNKGVQTKFDISTNELKGTSFAFGRQTRDYTIHTFTNDGKEFGASVFHAVHKNVELGAQLGWNVGDQNVRFGLASKYRLNPLYVPFLFEIFFKILINTGVARIPIKRE